MFIFLFLCLCYFTHLPWFRKWGDLILAKGLHRMALRKGVILCLLVCKCQCTVCVCVCVDHGGIAWSICTGPVHLRNCLWVCRVLTMFWTISPNKLQPKLLVSVSVAKWQTGHPPTSKAAAAGMLGRERKTEGKFLFLNSQKLTLLSFHVLYKLSSLPF